MDGLHHLELVILLLTVVLALTTVAQALVIPYPILLVIGGLLLSLVPGLPSVILSPDLVFLVFLPPILWAAAYLTSWREFRGNLRPISLLAVGLVVVTTAAIAMVARRLLPGIGWAEAIALGAIVSPPDAVSATAIGKRLGIPRRVVMILEGESLVNDATALVLYRAAVAASVGGGFVLGDSILQFVFAATVGVGIGLTVGLAVRWALRFVTDSFTETAITLLAPYVAWVLGEVADASAVLACVAGGIYVRQHFSAAVSPVTRIQSRAVWDVLLFILNGFIFILIGLQLASLRDALPPGRVEPVLVAGLVVSAMAIVVRLGWVPLVACVPRWLSASIRVRDPLPPWSHIFLVAWTGMRGIVTLAAALALPVTTATGAPFPFRAEIILISFCVILVTLVLQGLSLPPLIRALALPAEGGVELEIGLARSQATAAALQYLHEMVDSSWAHAAHVTQLRTYYEQRHAGILREGPADPACTVEMAQVFARLRHETLSAERRALIALRNNGTISDDVLHELERELDVEALHLGLGERRMVR